MILYRTLGDCVARPLQGLLFRPIVEGRERIPKRGPAVLACNHESLIDPFVLGYATWRRIHYMAKAELWEYPVLRNIMNAFDTFPVRRGAGDASAISAGLALLERGEVLGIFPQGTCLPYRERPWRRGAARLALGASVPLIPVCLVGTERALRPGKPRVGLPRLRILVGEPLAPEGDAAELTERLRFAVEELRAPYGPPAHAWRDQPVRDTVPTSDPGAPR